MSGWNRWATCFLSSPANARSGPVSRGASKDQQLGSKKLFYKMKVRQKPSGDNAQGGYEFIAAVQLGDGWWEMMPGFLGPVRPELLSALGYVDAVQRN
jgi:hypothetical protein